MTYKIIVKHKGHEDMITAGVDKLNAIVIPAELRLQWPREFKDGTMEVIVEPEEEE